MYIKRYCNVEGIAGLEKGLALLRNRFPTIICLLALLVLFAACKKDKEAADNDEFPVLGTCTVVEPTTGVSYTDATGPYTLRTDGGGKIVIDPSFNVIISYDSYPGFKIELWGELMIDGVAKTAANHENLNGKHIKDRLGNNRTILFPDGAKLTLVTEGPYKRLLSVTLFDGNTTHHINTTCNKLEYSAVSASVARWLDEEQPDGEAGGFEITSTGLKFFNQYTEEVKGNKVNNRYELGELIKSQPNLVNDFYDDPRLAAT